MRVAYSSHSDGRFLHLRNSHSLLGYLLIDSDVIHVDSGRT